VKKGFASAFTKFDAYQLRKYLGAGKDVSLIDVARLVHARGVDGSPLQQMIKGTLPAAETWETRVSAAGGDAEQKSEAYAGLIREGKMGYMALVRNLRNILKACDSEIIDMVCKQLVEPKRIRGSRIFPFTIYTAYVMLGGDQGEVGFGWGCRGVPEIEGNTSDIRKVLVALSDAVDLSMENCPELPGRTLVAVDSSGSMTAPAGGSAVVRMQNIGTLLGSVFYKRNPGSDMCLWADRADVFTINPRIPAVEIVKDLAGRCNRVGCGTNIGSIFEYARRAEEAYDRIIILSDMQSWWGSARTERNRYESALHVRPWLYCWDLSGGGTMQFPEGDDKVACLTGFSDKVLDMMAKLEGDRMAMIAEIEAITL
jgi:hypothetical protein